MNKIDVSEYNKTVNIISKYVNHTNNINIMGIDPSLNGTGIALCSNNKLFFKTIRPVGYSGIKRLLFVENFISNIIKKNQIDIIVREDYAYNPLNAKMQYSLGELGGILKRLFFKYKTPYLNVAPTTLKKFITGNGRADKSNIKLFIYKKWNKSFEDDNIADAFGLFKIGEKIVEYLQNKKITLFDKAIVETILHKKIEKNKYKIRGSR